MAGLKHAVSKLNRLHNLSGHVINKRDGQQRKFVMSENWLKYKWERCSLAMLTGAQQPSARLCFFIAGLLVTGIVSVMLTVTDIQRAHLSEPLALFWHLHWEGTRNKLATATLSWLSKHAKPSRSPILIAWKIGGRRHPASGSGCWHNSLYTSRRTASFSFDWYTHA